MQTKSFRSTHPPTDPTSPLGFLIPFSGSERRIPVQLGDCTTIGRDATCAISVRDSYASGRHARIDRKPGGWTLRDLNSRNGLFLNGSRVVEAPLSANDKIRIGETVFVFSDTSSAPPPMTSRNPAWNEALQRLPAFALTDFPVLLTGPSGSGKDVLATWIHSASTRSAGPFITLNCSALSENLIESELFGHVKGSFTGAGSDRKGAFEAARSGTLFLDEIGDLPLHLQPKLLRALENGEIKPVGSDRTTETDVRVIAATHKDLPARTRSGDFRVDLYYRLAVCEAEAPRLSERMEAFEDLLYRFARELKVRFSYGAVEALKEHSWPGNVRELRNVVARAAAYFPGKHILAPDVISLVDRIRFAPEISYLAAAGLAAGLVTGLATGLGASGTDGQMIKGLERDMIIQRLVANRGNQRQTAQDLGLPKSTLHDRIKTYCIDLKVLTDPGL